MTRDHDLGRVLDRWLAEGPTRAPDRLFDTFVDRIDHVPQRRLARLQTRLSTTNLKLRLAAAAAVVVLVAGLGAAIPSQRPAVGVRPSSTPLGVPSASPLSSVDPGALLSTWTSVGDRVFPFRNGSHTLMPSARIDITIEASDILWSQGSSDALSSKTLVGPDTIAFRWLATSPSDWNCQLGEVGTYRFGLSSDGRTLTLTTLSDACAPRATVLAGEWVRTDMGKLAPGLYVATLFRPFDGGKSGQLSYAVPTGWTDAYECGDCFWLTMPNAGARVSIWAKVGPIAQCGDTTVPVARSAAEVSQWLTTLTGLTASTPTPVSIGGLTGLMVDLSVATGWTDSCTYNQDGNGSPGATLGPRVYSSTFMTLQVAAPDSSQLNIEAGSRARYILLDLGGAQTLVIDLETDSAGGWDALIRDAMPVVNSFQFSH